MLTQKEISVEFYIPQPIVEQVKNQMLQFIINATDEVKQIVFPVLSEDYADAVIALADNEVQQALNQRNLTALVQRVGSQNPEPKIVIATYDQVTNGDLDRYLRGDS